ncbi:hypothetical protein RF11_09896 [Thelohanellus kitauei]|uniref:Uncharacterized protein n=1 Tax=Thelohanellus kitauei TaxID=669202 RepID=A0A0C2MQ06_THEKT|nr:hypothetical protein RF11_09896 [Thelohanellus kitauei]
MNSPFDDESLPSNQSIIREYYSHGLFGGILVQMKSVRKLITYFSSQNNLEDDKLILEHFPVNLSSEFDALCEGGTNFQNYEGLKLLFLDFFTFIFRNQNLVMEHQARSFIELFLKFIKTHHVINYFYLDALMDSIIVCVSYEPNKILFINHNAMFNFYYFFRIQFNSSSQKFWTMFEQVYTIEPINISSLCHNNLTESVNGMMRNFRTTGEQECANMLLIVLKMVHNLRLLMEVEFDVRPILYASV